MSCARHAAVGFAFANHHIPEVERVINLLARFVKCDAFRAPQFVVAHGITVAFLSASVIKNGNACERKARPSSLISYDFFSPDERDASDALGYAKRGGANGALILPFG